MTPVVPDDFLTDREVVFARNQCEYVPLPAVRLEDNHGTVVTRWHVTWRERLRILFGGSVWLTILTFGDLLQPVKLTTACPITSDQEHDSYTEQL